MSKTVCESSILVSGCRIRILIFQEAIPTPVRSLQERPEDSNRAEDSKPGGETPAPKPSFGRMTQRQAWFQKFGVFNSKVIRFQSFVAIHDYPQLLVPAIPAVQLAPSC